ncbi:hypothetical protein Pyn_29731 [Prunus yedoensis var. nudiflora]|uniref:Uncharacterized protein n=1 Tax=Prunus yedoensis var. nudiflora TaxID=2094558 RepID=A0A314YDT7_PRUYE|nr:hypothetical protein Pyn_29731 [Prunus yedoensis var. nudiflora]
MGKSCMGFSTLGARAPHTTVKVHLNLQYTTQIPPNPERKKALGFSPVIIHLSTLDVDDEIYIFVITNTTT